MSAVLIIDYGLGNIGSLRNMFRRLGAVVDVAGDEASIGRARKLLLPGVGAFDPAMRRLRETGLGELVRRRALVDRIPIMGICLGMQLLTEGSDEGREPGLGIVPARAHRFPASDKLKVPHMGWNLVRKTSPSPLTDGLPDDSRFYFVHSYHVQVDDQADSILKTTYGREFDAAFQRDNVFGAQFHPEKSHRFGMILLKAFANLPC